MRDLLLAADSHLRADDADTERFLRFLRREGSRAAAVVLAGDIFDLWVAWEGLELPYHRAVIGAIDDLRRAGVEVRYVEGNRDYFVGERYGRGPFTEVAAESLRVRHAHLELHVAHGDLVNARDRQYRAWRRLSRSSAVQGGFRLLPSRAAARLSGFLERKMRTTNRAYRVSFPEAQAAQYARRAFAAGADAVVLGHFHEARVTEFPAGAGAGPGRLFVLPGWREERRYLRFDGAGEATFVEFTG